MQADRQFEVSSSSSYLKDDDPKLFFLQYFAETVCFLDEFVLKYKFIQDENPDKWNYTQYNKN